VEFHHLDIAHAGRTKMLTFDGQFNIETGQMATSKPLWGNFQIFLTKTIFLE
jgi:hypothetical protein